MWNRRKFDLEGELRASRPRPRDEFVESLAQEVRSAPAGRSRVGRIGLAFALSGLTVVLFASFGGIGYAYSAAKHAVNKPTVATQPQSHSKSAAESQYQPYTPPKPKPPATPAGAEATVTPPPPAPPAPKPAAVQTSELPFTGLALWVPIALGLM